MFPNAVNCRKNKRLVKDSTSQSTVLNIIFFPDKINEKVSSKPNIIESGLTLVFISINGDVVMLIENSNTEDNILFRFVFINVFEKVLVIINEVS